MLKKLILLFFLFAILSITFYLEVEARSYVYSDELQASSALVHELLDALVPMEALVQAVYPEYIILNIGRQEGVREGQQFEIYQADTEVYLGLIEVVSVRSRNSDAEFIEKRDDVQIGDVAEEVKGGRVAVSSFLVSHMLETRLSRSLQELIIYNLGRLPGYDVVERIELDRILQELELSYTGLLDEVFSRQAGHLLGADFVVMGSIQERVDELLVTARLNHLETGVTLATAMVGISKTSSVMEQLRSIEPEVAVIPKDKDYSSIDIFPAGPLFFYPGERIALRATVMDEGGFIDDSAQVTWAVSRANIDLSVTQGDDVVLTAIEPGEVQVRASSGALFSIIEVTVKEPRDLGQIAILPSEAQFFIGENQRFKVLGKDQFGDEMVVVGAEWKILTGSGELSHSTGESTVLRGLSEGIIELQVAVKELTEIIKVEVKPHPPELTSLEVYPIEKISLNQGETIALSAVPLDQYGEELDIPIYWSLLTQHAQLSSTTGRNINLTAQLPGRALVQVEAGNLKEQFEIDITYTISGQVIGPDGRGLEGVSISGEDLDPVITDSQGRWQITGLQEEILVTPFLKKHSFEPPSHRAEGMEMALNFEASPFPPRLVEMYIVPSKIEIYLEDSLELKAKGVDQYGEEYLVSPTWSLSSTIGRLAKEEGRENLFQAHEVGLVEVEARVDDLSVKGVITVSYGPSILKELHIESSRAQMKTGERESLTFIAKDQYGREMTVDGNWSVISGPGLLSKNRGVSAVFSSQEPGRSMIQVAVGDISATITIQVDPRVPTRIIVSPADLAMSYGRTQTIEVKIYDQDGEEIDHLLSLDLIKGSADVEVDGMLVLLTPTGFGGGQLLIGAGKIAEQITYSVYGFSLGAMLNQWIIREEIEAELYTGTLAFRYGPIEIEGSFGYGKANLQDSSQWDSSASPLYLNQVEGGFSLYLSGHHFEPFLRGRMMLTSGSWESFKLVGSVGQEERIDLVGELDSLTTGVDLGLRIRLGRRLSFLLSGGYEWGSNEILEITTNDAGDIVFVSAWDEDLSAASYGARIRFMF